MPKLCRLGRERGGGEVRQKKNEAFCLFAVIVQLVKMPALNYTRGEEGIGW